MEYEDLLEIEEKDHEDFLKWINDIKAGKKDVNYPNIKKYEYLREPIGEISFNNIWSAVPSFNTLFVPIYPIYENSFFKTMHGFSKEDIPRLADFSRDTKRIRFFLSSSPTEYLGLDFFDPIFELEPHPITLLPPELFFENEKERIEKAAEFDVLANINFYDFNLAYLKSVGSSESDYKRRMYDYCYDYIMLYALGYYDVVDYLEEIIVSDPNLASIMLNILHHYIINPKVVPYDRIPVYDIETHKFSEEKLKALDLESEELFFPYEIGKYVMEKACLLPESLTACEHICAIYEQEDYYNVVKALHYGVKSKDNDILQKSTVEISEIMDNIWAESSKIKSRTTFITYGFSIGFAVIGAVAGGIPGAALGILGSLGITAGLDILKTESEPVYEGLAKKLTDSHLCTIFDFSKKYNINSK